MKLWDVILMESMEDSKDNLENLPFLDCTCMAMIRFVRSQVILAEEMTDILSILSKYPSVTDIKFLIKIAYINQAMLKNPSGLK